MGTVLSFSPRTNSNSTSVGCGGQHDDPNNYPPDLLLSQHPHLSHLSLPQQQQQQQQPFKKHSLFLNALSWKRVNKKHANLNNSSVGTTNNGILTANNNMNNGNNMSKELNNTHNNKHHHHGGVHHNNGGCNHNNRLPLDTIQPFLNNQHNINLNNNVQSLTQHHHHNNNNNNNNNLKTSVIQSNQTKLPPVLSHRGECSLPFNTI